MQIVMQKKADQFTLHTTGRPELTAALRKLQEDTTRRLSPVLVQILEPALRAKFPELFPPAKASVANKSK